MPDDIPQFSQQAVDYLATLEAERQSTLAAAEASKSRDDLHSWCKDFVQRSANWRVASYEDSWHKWQRAADSIYEPDLKSTKEAWQSRAYIPVTASHRETIQASLFKTMMGPRPPLEMKRRPHIPEERDQSENVRDLILREMEKSRYEIVSNRVLDDATTYGSGFCLIYWDEKVEPRKVRKPIPEKFDISDVGSVMRKISGQARVQGYEDYIENVPVYRGIRFQHISIWDVFPDPIALDVKGNTIAYRYILTYGEIVAGSQAGYYYPEAVGLLKGVASSKKPAEKQLVDADRGISSETSTPPDYGAQIECYCLYGRLPRKWVSPDSGGDPEELIASRIVFAKDAMLWAEPSGAYDGEPQIYKMDYMPVNGEFYGKGVPKMLADIQEVINETVNQRIDNVGLCLNKGFAVIEKAILDRKDFVSKPGFVIRMNGKAVSSDDVSKMVMPIEIGDVTRSAYADVQEMERYAQERTGANRMTLGTAGQVNDANRTLGGMEMLKASAGEKFYYIGLLVELSWTYEVFRAYWKDIYANISIEDVINAIGQERAKTFQLMSPEDIETQYRYEPQGVFLMENRAQRQARLSMIYQTFANQPWVDHVAFFDKIVQTADEDPITLKLAPQQMQMMMQAQALQSGALDMPGPKGAPGPMPGVEKPAGMA